MHIHIYIRALLLANATTPLRNKPLSLSLIKIRVEFLMDKEECSSSESGWTTYLSSPIKVDEDEVVDEDYYYEGYNIYNYSNKVEHEEERNKDSDDSMASDASSGPNYQRFHQKNKALDLKNGKIEGNTKSKNDDDHHNHYHDGKKTSNSYRKKDKKREKIRVPIG
ncbi:hypothetical protein AtNW77_Chr5g0120681 [Arabidopsis thaliana]